jgi:tetratricopeptide (TPR) repeat protein
MLSRNISLFLFVAVYTLWSSSDSGWDHLLINQVDSAESHFTKVIHSNKADAQSLGQAWRGLGEVATWRGDNALAAEYFLNGILADKDPELFSVYLLPVMTEIRNLNPTLKPRVEQLNQWLAKHHRNHPLWATFYKESGKYIERTGDTAEIKEYYDSLNILRDWMYAGPFDNVSNAGMFREYPPERGFNFKDTYRGLSGIPVSWHKLEGQSADGWTFLDYHQEVQNAVNYFTTTVYSDSAQEVVLSFGVSGVFEIWLNSKSIARNEIFRNTDSEAFRIPLKLQKGANSVLLKLAHETSPYSNFIMRFSDAKGFPLRLKSIPEPLAGVQPGHAASLVENDLLKLKIGTAPPESLSSEHLIYLARNYLFSENFSESKPILRALQKRYPNSALVASLLGEVYSREANATLAEFQYERCWAADSTHSTAWLVKYMKFLRGRSWQQASDLYMHRPAKLKLPAAVLVGQIEANFYLGKENQGIALMDTLMKLHPGEISSSNFLIDIFYKMRDFKKAQDVITALETRWGYNNRIAGLVFDHLIQIGRNEEAITYLKKAIEISPQSVGYYYKLSEEAFNQEDYEFAHEMAQKALLINPTSAMFYNQIGKIKEKQNQKDQARKAYQKALDLNYSNYELHNHLRSMEGLSPLNSIVTNYNRDSLSNAGASWKAGRSENSLILLDQKSIVVYPGGGYESLDRILVEVLDHKGVDDWKEYEIQYESNYEKISILSAVTLKPDGKTLEADQGGNSLVFKNLEPGDRLEIRLLRKFYFIGELAGHFWGSHYFESEVPIFHSLLEIYTPETSTFQVKQKDLNLKVKKSRVENMRVSRWAQTKIPAKKSEQRMPPYKDAMAWIQISSVKDWGFITNWYDGLSRGKSVATLELQILADSLFAGAPSSDEKLRRVHHFITNTIRYSSKSFRQSGFIPQDASKTLATRVGDCKDMSTLAKTLLSLSGVESSLVLTRTSDQGQADVLPSIEFNHCILKTGSDQYIDFTSLHNAWNSLPRDDQGGRALEIEAGSSTLIALPYDPIHQEKNFRSSSDTLFADGLLARRVQTVREGNLAAWFRSYNRYENNENRRLSLMRALKRGFSAVDLLSWDYPDFDSLNTSVDYQYHFRAQQAAVVSSKTIVMPFPWIDKLGAHNLVGEDKRNHVLQDWRQGEFWGTFEHELSLILPSGYTLIDLPANKTLKWNKAEYKVEFKLEGRKILAKRTLVMEPQDINPADFLKYKAFMQNLVESDNSYLVLLKDTAGHVQ